MEGNDYFSNVMSETFNPLLDLELNTNPQKQLSQNVGAAPTESKPEKIKEFQRQEDALLVSSA
jgi:hypothetical protein